MQLLGCAATSVQITTSPPAASSGRVWSTTATPPPTAWSRSPRWAGPRSRCTGVATSSSQRNTVSWSPNAIYLLTHGRGHCVLLWDSWQGLPQSWEAGDDLLLRHRPVSGDTAEYYWYYYHVSWLVYRCNSSLSLKVPGITATIVVISILTKLVHLFL